MCRRRSSTIRCPDEEGYQIFLGPLEEDAPLKMVSTGKGRCTCPFFHPSGKSILFASTHLSPSTEAEPPKGPAYSRSARYRWEFPETMDIFTADLDGKNLKRLTDTPGYDAEASYSPDGSQIVFTSFRDGDGEIYIMDASGKNARRITHAQGLRRRPVLFSGRPANHLPQRPQGQRPASGLREQHRGHGRAGLDPERIRQLGPVLAPGRNPHHLRDQQARAFELRALSDERRHGCRGTHHVPRRLRRAARVQPGRQAPDVDLERPHRRPQEPALHRGLHAGAAKSPSVAAPANAR